MNSNDMITLPRAALANLLRPEYVPLIGLEVGEVVPTRGNKRVAGTSPRIGHAATVTGPTAKIVSCIKTAPLALAGIVTATGLPKATVRRGLMSLRKSNVIRKVAGSGLGTTYRAV